MPYAKLKNENYQNLGGINQKASPFMTGANEALALLNWDYQRPGAYGQRPGTSTYLGGGGTSVLSLTEFSRLSGASWKIFNQGSDLFSYNGATALVRHMGVTFGQSSLGFTYIPSTQNLLDFQPFVDRLFVAGSNFDFFKTDGVNAYSFSVPPGVGALGLLQTTEPTSGWTGWYQYAYAFVNEMGTLGPIQPGPPYGGPTGVLTNVTNVAVAGATSIRLSVPTTAQIDAMYSGGLNTITQSHGLSSIVFFRSGPYASDATGDGPSFIGSLFDIGSMPIGACTFFYDFGATFGPLHQTGSSAANFNWFTLIPRYINLYNNAMFFAGFSTLPSTLYFSSLGQPETIGATASFEVRSNDSDRITGMINYASAQIIFKRFSTHYLTGFSSDDYALRQLSAQYGCLSNRAACVWQDKLWFLDSDGINEYNGARIASVSNRISTTFRRMNVAAAIDNAIMLHVKERNEIWTAFPIDGATQNNYLVVYDYLADAFTEWFGPQAASLAIATGPSQLLQPFYGDYSGSIHFFDPIFYSDSGRAFTCSVFSRFFGDMGFSVTKQFRRLYFDFLLQQSSGNTHVLRASLFSDMDSATVQFSTTFPISSTLPQQNRIEFGVPGRSLAFQLHHIAQDSALQFSGFTVEYRFQRAVSGVQE
jgi:hypothetical protein